MYVKKMYGYIVSTDMFRALTKGPLDSYSPRIQKSRNYKNWIAVLDLQICMECRSRHGQIYWINETPDKKPPIHPNCRCEIKLMRAVLAGYGTKDRQNGADYWIKYFSDLPEYYIARDELLSLGREKGKLPAKFAPGKMAIMGIYQNRNGRLPQRAGRIWYETDINYYKGRRKATACYGQTTDCCMSPTSMMKHFLESTCYEKRKNCHPGLNRL